jgi:S-adenosyl-L-methionine hydrolase (adenosine-forming)
MNDQCPPIITLTTDFGHKGPFVGIMKGVILSRLPQARIVDLTHEVHAHWPAEAGFWLAHSYKNFPIESIHLAVVDPGVGTERDILGCKHDGHVFLAPDNGILSDVLGSSPPDQVYRLSKQLINQINPDNISSTFHGRDVLAPLAAEIALGNIKIETIGEKTCDIVPSLVEQAEHIGSRLQGTIVAIDSFGNLISNVSHMELKKINNPKISCGGRHLHLQDTYGRSQPGEFLALINSFDMLEIARAEGNASEHLGLGLGAPISISTG